MFIYYYLSKFRVHHIFLPAVTNINLSAYTHVIQTHNKNIIYHRSRRDQCKYPYFWPRDVARKQTSLSGAIKRAYSTKMQNNRKIAFYANIPHTHMRYDSRFIKSDKMTTTTEHHIIKRTHMHRHDCLSARANMHYMTVFSLYIRFQVIARAKDQNALS